jgi:twitching motility protein PilT
MKVTEQLKIYLNTMVDRDLSDLHISANALAYGRKNGTLTSIDDYLWSESEVDAFFEAIATEPMKRMMSERFSVDGSCSLGTNRFRLNFYRERGFMAIAIRRLNSQLQSFESLGLPDTLLELADLKDGLVLFTGPTGSGKSTSLAALINHINENRPCHIMTVEDPIEYLHTNKKALVHQRELGLDVTSFSASLREALREDPDVILVGEMRDLDTIRAAITAAETGHLVFSTLHCGDTVGALDRMLAMYPADEQESIRRQLGMALKAVVAQTLIPKMHDGGRLPALEILRCTPAVQNLIHTRQFSQIYTALETGSAHGMLSIDEALADYVNRQEVDEAVARSRVRNRELFDDKLRTARSGRGSFRRTNGGKKNTI